MRFEINIEEVEDLNKLSEIANNKNEPIFVKENEEITLVAMSTNCYMDTFKALGAEQEIADIEKQIKDNPEYFE